MGLPITDPDQLNDATEIVISTSAKTVQLVKTGNLGNDGVTIKCVYSKLKELWKTSTDYIKFPFPMGPITDEQFEMINGWDWKDDTTRYVLRNGGWALKDSGGVSQEEWAGIVSLGSIGTNDQAYFVQSGSLDPVDFQLAGPVNQAIKVYGDGSHGSFDRRGYLRIYCRIYGKSYAFAQISDLGVTTLTYKMYGFPLANSTDAKITHTDANLIGNTPYFGAVSHADTDGAVTTGDPTFTSVGSFSAGDVGKWICIDPGTTQNYGVYKIITFNDQDSVDVDRNFTDTEGSIAYSMCPTGMSIEWFGTAQQRDIGGTEYDFHAIIDGNDGTAEQVYEYVQYMLRQIQDIDVGSGTQKGKKTSALLRFVGDTLYTQPVTEGGVFIDNYQDADVNRLVFTDDDLAEWQFPYTSILTLNFGENLQNDTSAKYWVYFTTNVGGNYGTANAILVDDADVADMTGNISAQSSIQLTFAYGTNVQGGRTAGTDADITAVAIGLDTAQFVKATGIITRSIANTVSLVASLERNYSN